MSVTTARLERLAPGLVSEAIVVDLANSLVLRQRSSNLAPGSSVRNRLASSLLGVDLAALDGHFEQNRVFDTAALDLMTSLIERASFTNETISLLQQVVVAMDDSLTKLESRTELEQTALRQRLVDLETSFVARWTNLDDRVERLELRQLAQDELAGAFRRWDESDLPGTVLLLYILVSEIASGQFGRHIGVDPSSPLVSELSDGVVARLELGQASVSHNLQRSAEFLSDVESEEVSLILESMSLVRSTGPWHSMLLQTVQFRALPDPDRPRLFGRLAFALTKARWPDLGHTVVPGLITKAFLTETTSPAVVPTSRKTA